MAELDSDVLIVGGGPTGVTLALIAAQHGARVMLCEKEADIYPLPRAAHVDHEVMRIFQSVGAADAIAATSRTSPLYDFLTPDRQILLRFEGMDRIGPGGWPGGNMIHQPSVERVLRARLEAVSPGSLHSGWTYLGHQEQGGQVVARFATPEGEQRLRTRFLVGADGTRSPVRSAIGVELDDLAFDEPWLVVDAIVHDFEALPKANLQICDPARPTTCVLMGEGRHRWEFMLLPGENPEQVTEDGFIARLLEPWNVAHAVTLERKAVYRFNARVAQQWRKGPVLLAGDAAHQTPPFAGQGMCAGIRDAANLGWKLGQIVSGQASPALLDSYQPEREPHVRATIQMAIMMGRTVCITDPAAAAERDRQMLAARAAGQSPDGAVSYPPVDAGLIWAGSPGAGSYFPQFPAGMAERLDENLGPEAWLIASATAEAIVGVSPISLTDPRLGEAAAPIAAWLAHHDAQAVLVRPDRIVFGTGAPHDLVQRWKEALTLPGD